jgi:Cu/Ag efflux protein CusF
VFVAILVLTASACAKHYSSTGLILKIDKPGSTVTISHEPFPGFMDAMAMPFDLKGGAQRVALTAGDRVKLRLSVKGSRSWIDRLDVISAAPVDAGLEQTPVTHVLVPVGATCRIRAHDQTGARSRCPRSRQGRRRHRSLLALPAALITVPGWWRTSARIRARFATGWLAIWFYSRSASIPQYDTPQVLAQYAASMRAGGPGWHFLTGDPANVERVCNAFGIQYFPDEGLITHSLQTAVVDRNGPSGSDGGRQEFTPRQLGDLIATVLEQR